MKNGMPELDGAMEGIRDISFLGWDFVLNGLVVFNPIMNRNEEQNVCFTYTDGLVFARQRLLEELKQIVKGSNQQVIVCLLVKVVLLVKGDLI